ncbi:hypothetical protein WFZ85_08225 [Flavobacterium sp. j3]|uniref:Bacteriocin n=1 Tax=Flavobacterium aureirubrum TaxID=3133147 RepID=A0ABU9N777_9FLAO
MKNFKKLSREELKNTFGGRSCKLVTVAANGTTITQSGTCSTTFQAVPGYYNGSFGWVLEAVSYCNTGDGVAHTLSSNGGNSRC